MDAQLRNFATAKVEELDRLEAELQALASQAFAYVRGLPNLLATPYDDIPDSIRNVVREAFGAGLFPDLPDLPLVDLGQRAERCEVTMDANKRTTSMYDSDTENIPLCKRQRMAKHSKPPAVAKKRKHQDGDSSADSGPIPGATAGVPARHAQDIEPPARAAATCPDAGLTRPQADPQQPLPEQPQERQQGTHDHSCPAQKQPHLQDQLQQPHPAPPSAKPPAVKKRAPMWLSQMLPNRSKPQPAPVATSRKGRQAAKAPQHPQSKCASADAVEGPPGATPMLPTDPEPRQAGGACDQQRPCSQSQQAPLQAASVIELERLVPQHAEFDGVSQLMATEGPLGARETPVAPAPPATEHRCEDQEHEQDGEAVFAAVPGEGAVVCVTAERSSSSSGPGSTSGPALAANASAAVAAGVAAGDTHSAAPTSPIEPTPGTAHDRESTAAASRTSSLLCEAPAGLGGTAPPLATAAGPAGTAASLATVASAADDFPSGTPGDATAAAQVPKHLASGVQGCDGAAGGSGPRVRRPVRESASSVPGGHPPPASTDPSVPPVEEEGGAAAAAPAVDSVADVPTKRRADGRGSDVFMDVPLASRVHKKPKSAAAVATAGAALPDGAKEGDVAGADGGCEAVAACAKSETCVSGDLPTAAAQTATAGQPAPAPAGLAPIETRAQAAELCGAAAAGVAGTVAAAPAPPGVSPVGEPVAPAAASRPDGLDRGSRDLRPAEAPTGPSDPSLPPKPGGTERPVGTREVETAASEAPVFSGAAQEGASGTAPAAGPVPAVTAATTGVVESGSAAVAPPGADACPNGDAARADAAGAGDSGTATAGSTDAGVQCHTAAAAGAAVPSPTAVRAPAATARRAGGSGPAAGPSAPVEDPGRVAEVAWAQLWGEGAETGPGPGPGPGAAPLGGGAAPDGRDPHGGPGRKVQPHRTSGGGGHRTEEGMTVQARGGCDTANGSPSKRKNKQDGGVAAAVGPAGTLANSKPSTQPAAEPAAKVERKYRPTVTGRRPSAKAGSANPHSDLAAAAAAWMAVLDGANGGGSDGGAGGGGEAAAAAAATVAAGIATAQPSVSPFAAPTWGPASPEDTHASKDTCEPQPPSTCTAEQVGYQDPEATSDPSGSGAAPFRPQQSHTAARQDDRQRTDGEVEPAVAASFDGGPPAGPAAMGTAAGRDASPDNAGDAVAGDGAFGRLFREQSSGGGSGSSVGSGSDAEGSQEDGEARRSSTPEAGCGGGRAPLAMSEVEQEEWRRRQIEIERQRAEAAEQREAARRARVAAQACAASQADLHRRMRQRLAEHHQLASAAAKEAAAKEELRARIRNHLQEQNRKALEERSLSRLLKQLGALPKGERFKTVEQRNKVLKAAKIRFHPDKASGGLEARVYAEEVSKLLNSCEWTC